MSYSPYTPNITFSANTGTHRCTHRTRRLLGYFHWFAKPACIYPAPIYVKPYYNIANMSIPHSVAFRIQDIRML